MLYFAIQQVNTIYYLCIGRGLTMQNAKTNRDKIVFINLTEMNKYNGLEANLKGGGRFIDQNGYGHEIFNFQNDNGKCYGYTPSLGKINLRRISKEISQDVYGDYVDNVFVVFTCSRKSKGRIVCGFYQNARIYAEPVNDNRNTRIIETNEQKIFAAYNIICSVEKVILIDRDDRIKQLPHSKHNNGIGHGQNPVWYVDDPKRKNLKDDLIDYAEEIINKTNINDEHKYHLYDENKPYISSTNQNYRSQAAKNECIRLKGCHCNICGFNFEETYGKIGKGFIEVHHITPIGKLSTAANYNGTNPQTDLIPICSNCHSMIHRRKKPYQPKEIKALFHNKD